MLFGVWDVLTLVLMLSINACMNLFGLLMETMNYNRKKIDWSPFWFGCFAGAVPWAVIFAMLAGTPARDRIPAFVFAIFVIYLRTWLVPSSCLCGFVARQFVASTVTYW